MFVVTNNDEKYRVWFKKNIIKREDRDQRFVKEVLETYCFIEKWADKVEDRTRVSEGKVTCFYADHENDVIGRKMAFTKAVSCFSKKDRTLFWQIFRENVRVNSRSSFETFKRKLLNRLYDITQHEEVTEAVFNEIDTLADDIFTGQV